jgi:protein SCO1
VLNGLVDALNRVDLQPGKDFDIVTYSFSYDEKTELASHKKAAYLTQYKKDGAKDGWHFLTGPKQSVDTLCDAIGFKVNRLPDGQIAHKACIVFVTPDGTISQYMSNVQFEPRDVQLALVDSSKGTISSPVASFLLLTCFCYDPATGTYVASAWKIMRSGGIVTLVLLGGGLLLLFWLESRKRHGTAGDGHLMVDSQDNSAAAHSTGANAASPAEGGWHT